MALISLSRRTDLPAFYGQWVINRLKSGFCLVHQPFRADVIKRVDLRSEAVDGLVFWTRHPPPFVGHLDHIERLGYAYYFQVTLTGMPRLLEPRRPSVEDCLTSFEALAGRIGPPRLMWRFDPILITNLTPPQEVAARFERLCDRLAPKSRRVVVSLAQLYAKTKRRLGKVRGLTVIDLHQEENLAEDLLGRLAQTAQEHDLEMRLCAAERDYSHLGINPGKCIDEGLFNEYYGLKLTFEKDRGQRPACGCARSIDIGAYNTCLNGCRYCYATASHLAAMKNFQRHDPEGEELIGPGG